MVPFDLQELRKSVEEADKVGRRALANAAKIFAKAAASMKATAKAMSLGAATNACSGLAAEAQLAYDRGQAVETLAQEIEWGHVGRKKKANDGQED